MKAIKVTALLIFFILFFGCTHGGPKEFGELEHLRQVSYEEFAALKDAPRHSDELNERSTLRDYLSYAALHNPGLKAAFNSWKAALERIPQVRSLPDPRFNYAYFIQEVETRVGPQRQKFGLAQTFPWFGKLSLKGDAAFQVANAEREKYEAKKLELFYQVKNTYYEYYYLARAVRLAKENLKLLEFIEDIARTKYATGIGSFSDVIKAQMELGKLRDRLGTLKDLRDPLVAKLNVALNRPANALLPWPQVAPRGELTLSEEKLIAKAKEANPELKVKDFLASKEKIGIDLAKKNYFPDITLGVEWIDTEKANKPNTEDSGKDPVIAMFSINLPIWYGKYEAAKHEAQAKLLRVQNEREQKENSLIADLRMALYKFHDAGRKIHLYKDVLIPKANETLHSNLQSFETGGGSFINLIDTQRTLLEFQLLYERAVANREQALARIERIVGEDMNVEPDVKKKHATNRQDKP